MKLNPKNNWRLEYLNFINKQKNSSSISKFSCTQEFPINNYIDEPMKQMFLWINLHYQLLKAGFPGLQLKYIFMDIPFEILNKRSREELFSIHLEYEEKIREAPVHIQDRMKMTMEKIKKIIGDNFYYEKDQYFKKMRSNSTKAISQDMELKNSTIDRFFLEGINLYQQDMDESFLRALPRKDLSLLVIKIDDILPTTGDQFIKNKLIDIHLSARKVLNDPSWEGNVGYPKCRIYHDWDENDLAQLSTKELSTFLINCDAEARKYKTDLNYRNFLLFKLKKRIKKALSFRKKYETNFPLKHPTIPTIQIDVAKK